MEIIRRIPFHRAEIIFILTAEGAYLARIIIGDPQLRGKGLGKEIVSHLLVYAFEILQQTKVYLNVFDWNTAAIKCYEKAGFCINPGKKAERVINGQTWIALNMTIDKQQWNVCSRNNLSISGKKKMTGGNHSRQLGHNPI